MSALLDHLWQSTLFGLAVWLITLALVSNRAAVRHALWFAASLKFLVPFAPLVWLGQWIGMAPEYDTLAPASPIDRALQIAAPIIAPSAQLTDVAHAFPWLSLLAFAWLAGGLVAAVRWFNAWRGAQAAVRDAWPVLNDDGLDVRASPDAGEPAVARILRPVVLVPAGLVDALSRAELRVVLAHEREHIVRRDNLKTGLHMLVETLFWFHPMVWWIGRHMVEERERACDEAVVDGGHEGRDYAAGILAVCRHCCADRRLPGTISALSGDLPQRIGRIIGGSQPLALGLVKAMALSTLVVALVTVPVTAGAVKDERARQEAFVQNARALGSAQLSVAPVSSGGARTRVVAGVHELRIENVTMLDLVALAYDVDPSHINGGEVLGTQRYDISAKATSSFAAPERFEPAALRGVVSKLLGAHFRFEVYVNKRCQAPCGPRALTLEPR